MWSRSRRSSLARDALGRRASRGARPQRTGRVDIVALTATGVALGTMFFGPFLSNEPYRNVYGSGDFNGFASAYPVDELAEVKQALADLPQGKTVVLPPTETAKLVVGSDGVAHTSNAPAGCVGRAGAISEFAAFQDRSLEQLHEFVAARASRARAEECQAAPAAMIACHMFRL